MTIKIISGSIAGLDVFGGLTKLKKEGFFYQWYLTKKGWGSKKAKTISFSGGLSGSMVRIVQTTGSGKTLLAAIWLYRAHKAGRKTAANMPFSFLDKEITTYDEFIDLKGYHVLLDDIRHIIQSWQGKDARIATELSNGSRKKHNGIDITTQRLENYVPPDIRMITDEIHVPFIRCFDARRKSPDQKNYYPLELCDLRFSAGMEFLDMKRYNLSGRTGQLIMGTFDTLNISGKLE